MHAQYSVKCKSSCILCSSVPSTNLC